MARPRRVSCKRHPKRPRRGLPQGWRDRFQRLHRGLEASWAGALPRGATSDGGAALWIAYLDLLARAFDRQTGYLTWNYAELLFARQPPFARRRYAFAGQDRHAWHALIEPLLRKRRAADYLDDTEFVAAPSTWIRGEDPCPRLVAGNLRGIVENWQHSVRPYYQQGKVKVAELEREARAIGRDVGGGAECAHLRLPTGPEAVLRSPARPTLWYPPCVRSDLPGSGCPMSPMRTCQQCGKPTQNPKFCGRECAATHNNRLSPKRRPEGACEECGTAIHKRKRHCDHCAPLVAEKERKKREGFISIPGPTGFIELKLPQVTVRKQIVFDHSLVVGQTPFSSSARFGELIDFLIGLAHGAPEYITQRDARRYVGMLCDLGTHQVTSHDWSTGVERKTPVRNMPVSELNVGLYAWVSSWLTRDAFPLMSTYALDAAEFVLAHAYGTDEHGGPNTPSWRIPPVLPQSLVDEPGRRAYFLHEPRFKRDITERIARLLAVVKVPPTGRCARTAQSAPFLEAGAQFLMSIQRCHLSSGVADYVDLEAIDATEPTIYLPCRFRLRGEIVGRHDGDVAHLADFNPWEVPRPDYRLRLEVPVPWITHVLCDSDGPTRWDVLPVPAWIHG